MFEDLMAIVLEVEVNGQAFTRAGHETLCVLHTNVTASGKLGRESQGTRFRGEDFEIDIYAGGLTSVSDKQRDQHMQWASRKKLAIGDEIRIRVLDDSRFDEPSETRPVKRYGGSKDAISERRRFRQAREIYSRLVFKYGTKREIAAFVTRRLAFLRGSRA
jgi:hypothetical protein